MNCILVLFLMGLSLAGCSNGFSSVDSSSGITPVLDCVGCTDIAGDGGSLKLMQTTGQVSVGGIMTQSVTSIPTGSWKTECRNNNKMILTVNNNDARLVVMLYHEVDVDHPVACVDLDEVRTYRYTYASMGTATDIAGANIMHIGMNQVVSEPYNSAVRQYIVDNCQYDNLDTSYQYQPGDADYGLNQDAVSDTSKLAYDVTQCKGFGSSTGGPTDTSLRFYTNGSILKMGDASNITSLGSFTK